MCYGFYHSLNRFGINEELINHQNIRRVTSDPSIIKTANSKGLLNIFLNQIIKIKQREVISLLGGFKSASLTSQFSGLLASDRPVAFCNATCRFNIK